MRRKTQRVLRDGRVVWTDPTRPLWLTDRVTGKNRKWFWEKKPSRSVQAWVRGRNKWLWNVHPLYRQLPFNLVNKWARAYNRSQKD